MSLVALQRKEFRKVFSVRKCMNCGRVLEKAHDIYSRRFCSVECKEAYCGQAIGIKTV